MFDVLGGRVNEEIPGHRTVLLPRECLDRLRVREQDPQRVLRDIGRRVAEVRKRRRQTQEQFAESIGLSHKYLQAIEGGRENLSVRSLVKLANLLRIRAGDLFRAPRSRQVRRGRPPKAN
jgi:DNA-binding XRE family transcriptional regulator